MRLRARAFSLVVDGVENLSMKTGAVSRADGVFRGSWPVAVGCRSGSRWSARSRAAARTTDLDARGPGGRLTGRGKAGSAVPGAVGTGRVGGEPRSSLHRLLGGRTRSDG